jgi:hypothetical protein
LNKARRLPEHERTKEAVRILQRLHFILTHMDGLDDVWPSALEFVGSIDYIKRSRGKPPSGSSQ